MPLPCFPCAQRKVLIRYETADRLVDPERRHVGVYFKALIMKLSASRPSVHPSVRRPRPSYRPPSIGLPLDS